MWINEIFVSIDGEVNFWGQGGISTFVRLSGCNLKCDYCDTPDTQDQSSGQELSVDEVFKRIEENETDKVTITGGEPFLQSIELQDLCVKLMGAGYRVSIETNGTIAIDGALKSHSKISLILDYKLDNIPNLSNYIGLSENAFIKIPIKSEEDFISAMGSKNDLRMKTRARFAFSAIVSKDFTHKDLFNLMMEHQQTDVILNVQLHKLIDLK